MEGNYIIVDFNGTAYVSILTKTKEFLESPQAKAIIEMLRKGK